MKELHMEKFDALLSLASAECVKEEAEAFLSADISEIGDNPQMLRKVLGGSRKGKWHTVKIILLVALLCMSIAFTACMLVPEIRQAIWNVLVRERESSVEIDFETNEEAVPANASIGGEYPATIERKMQVTYVPEGCIVSNYVSMPTQYVISYASEEDKKEFMITQTVIDCVDSLVNESEGQITYIEIAGGEAILMKCNDGHYKYKLVWQDDQYRYTICGSCMSIHEIIRIAEGVK